MNRHLTIGDLIEGRYRVDELLGSGAAGTVYLAFDKQLGRQVAIKILNLELSAESDASKRFIREAKTLSQLLHANIIRVYRYGVLSEKTPYLVMEYAKGLSLRQLLLSKKRLCCREVVFFAKQIAAALAYAHSAGIMHRDLKPENILVLESESVFNVRILDFGLSKHIEPAASPGSTITFTGMVLGTALYMSPEQCLGKDVDQRSDIYAFGCILHEMIKGAPPFMAESQAEVLFKQLNEPLPDLLQEFSACGLPPELAQLILKSCRKSKEERYGSFSEILDILSQIESLNCSITYDPKLAAQTAVAQYLKILSPRRLLIGIFLAALVSVLPFSYLCITKGFKSAIAECSVRFLPPSQAIDILSGLLADSVAKQDQESLSKLVDLSLSAESLPAWSSFDRYLLIQRFSKVLGTNGDSQELFAVQLRLLDQLLLQVQSGLESGRSRASADLSRPAEELLSLVNRLEGSKLTQSQWKQISKLLESKWRLPAHDQRAGNFLSLLWTFRARALSRTKMTEDDFASVAKFYLFALNDSQDLTAQSPLLEESIEFSRRNKIWHRLIAMHVLKGKLYLEEGKIQEARKQLMLAKSYSRDCILSLSEGASLLNLEAALKDP